MKNIKVLMLITVRLLLHSCFLFGQDKYFYKQYGQQFVENGRDITILDDTTIIVCGAGYDPNPPDWDSYILKVDQYGNEKEMIYHFEEEVRTNYRKIFQSNNGQLTLFGDTYFSEGYPTNLNSAIRMVKVNDSLGIEYTKWIEPDKNKDVEGVIKLNNDYIISGFHIDPADPVGFWQPYIARVDSVGELLWELELTGYEYNNTMRGLALDEANEIIYSLGSINVAGDESDFLFLKISFDGVL